MTVRMYKRIGNVSLGIAIAAILGFDSFQSHLIPGLVLIGAGAFALALNVFARFIPLTDSGQSTGVTSGNAEPELAVAHEELTTSFRGAIASTYGTRIGNTYQVKTPEEFQAPVADLLHAHREAEVMAMLNEQVAAGSRYWHARYTLYDRRYFSRRPLLDPDLRSARMAVEVAKSLNPQATEYDVMVTGDGTLTISPKRRNAQEEDFQREETRVLPQNEEESGYIN